jgi:hypothetical protein
MTLGINKQAGKSTMTNKQIVLTTKTGIEKNQKVAELLNSHFIEAVDELIKQNKYSQSNHKNR